jgi:crossover junction endodeoxyribonuclease RuvC
MTTLRILGIDPGTIVVGWACIELDERGPRSGHASTGVREVQAPLAARASNLVRKTARSDTLRLLEAGALRLGRGLPIEARLARLCVELEAWIERFAPQELAIEEAFHGKSPQAALRIGEARGVVLATAHRAGLTVHQFAPATIKRRVTGSGRAEKDVVARMALTELGAGPLAGPADAGDAVAVAFCRAQERQSPLAALTASR